MKLKWKLPLMFLTVFLLVFGVGLAFSRSIFLENRYLSPAERSVILTNLESFRFVYIIILTLITLVFIILSILMNYQITKPLAQLNLRLKMMNIYKKDVPPLPLNRKDEIGQLYQHFNDMEQKLQQANHEQLDMLGAVTHDLKTPLTAINGFMELLITRNDLTEEEKQEYYALVMKKSKHIEEVLSVFSTFEKQEAALASIDMQTVDAKAFLQNIAEEYDLELSTIGYQLTVNNHLRSNTFVLIDESMIRRTFGNLFNNAVKYGGRDDLCLQLSGEYKEGFVCFTVEDNGVGVPVNALDSLFQKFFTVDKARQSEKGGTGLGLASCKSIVERHSGTISAFQSTHGGLGIQFILPSIS